jgi:hypothetical protein
MKSAVAATDRRLCGDGDPHGHIPAAAASIVAPGYKSAPPPFSFPMVAGPRLHLRVQKASAHGCFIHGCYDESELGSQNENVATTGSPDRIASDDGWGR